MDPVGLLLDRLEKDPSPNAEKLRKLKSRLSREIRKPLLRNDVLLARYREQVLHGERRLNPELQRVLVLNAIRSQSGIITVTVLTKPYACPGRCVYCPTETRVPKSYLANEPAVMRAIQNRYDPYAQVATRLTALENTGHSTQKIELIIKGGTWSFYPADYQRWFMQRCFDAANNGVSGVKRQVSGEKGTTSLLEAQEQNETAKHRIVGITIETRPDYVTTDEILRLRRLGVTRVEMGVQSLEERILTLTIRDHGTREIAQATALLRDAGFKVAYHLMPNLPGATPEDDLRTFEKLFCDSSYRPDALKIYPCVVVKSAELYQWWRIGYYHPYDEETLLELLIDLKKKVPPYVRIERVIRDIPTTSIEAGCQVPNLRDEVARRMKERGISCSCIRCREVRGACSENFTLTRQDYEAAGGREIFLSFEDLSANRLSALLRLRIPSQHFTKQPSGTPALEKAALVRELHTYGWQLPIDSKNPQATQHRGLGRRLMQEAERIAQGEFGLSRMAVISGVGVREYYRKLGYQLEGTYMIKTLTGDADAPARKQTA